MSGYDLVAFDLDGTLVETAAEVTDAVNDTLLARGWSPVPRAGVAPWIGQGLRAVLERALAASWCQSAERVGADPRLPDLAREFAANIQRRSGTRSHPFPHVRATLSALRRRGTRLSVVTDREPEQARVLLDAHGLREPFDCVITGATPGAAAPDPAGLPQCLARCTSGAQRALFIGDSSLDAAAARVAGVDFWLVAHGYNLGHPPTRCAPDRVLRNFFEVDVALAGLRPVAA